MGGGLQCRCSPLCSWIFRYSFRSAHARRELSTTYRFVIRRYGLRLFGRVCFRTLEKSTFCGIVLPLGILASDGPIADLCRVSGWYNIGRTPRTAIDKLDAFIKIHMFFGYPQVKTVVVCLRIRIDTGNKSVPKICRVRCRLP